MSEKKMILCVRLDCCDRVSSIDLGISESKWLNMTSKEQHEEIYDKLPYVADIYVKEQE